MGGKGKKRKGGHGNPRAQSQKAGKKGQKHGELFEPTIVVKGKQSGHALPIPGLSNLGNTCFFNSVMQNLGQSHYFRARLQRVLASPSYSMEIRLPRGESRRRQLSVVDSVGTLTSKLASFLTQMQTSNGGCMNPRPVFSEICKKAPRFSGYHQQDSQELLRYLLDSLHSEETNRIKRAILTSYNVTGNMKEQQTMITASDRADIKAYGVQACNSQTFVYDVFGGVLISTVMCRECGSVSKMHETFLDLSLPVAEDKSMDSHSSPGGYQTRTRTQRDASSLTDIPKPGQETKQAGLSKHQLKKREKQARKAARNSQKKAYSHRTKISDETLEDQDDSDVSNQEESQVDGCLEGGAGKDTDEILPLTQDNNFRASEPTNLDQDPAERGVPKYVTVITTGEPQSASPIEESTDQQGTAMVQNGYAACGPLPDSSGNMKDLTENVARVKIRNEDTSPTTNNNVECESPPLHEGAVEDIGLSESSSQAAAATRSDLLADNFKSVKAEPLSLQFSLKKFCSVEVLTGSNRFACVVCTKLRAEKLLQVSEQGNQIDLPEEEKKESRRSDTSEDQEESKQFDSPRRVVSLDDHHVEVCDESKDTSKSNEDSCRISEREDRESEVEFLNLEDSIRSDEPDEVSLELQEGKSHSDEDDELASNDEDSPKSQEKEPSIAFCEASKQLLIEKVPPLLTLHLKRFIQIDRKLRKNNQHVSFPMVLDIGPLCVDSCKSDCDSEGQLLYSLYGVVEHSGSMHGGHYVAYVRARTPPNIPLDHVTNSTTQPDTTVTHNSDNLEDRNGDSMQIQDSVCSQQTTSDNSSNSAVSISLDNSINEAKVTNSTLNFDLSSTKGQWYYISDSHVRTATENEVAKSQAYLLFYERLPLVM